MKINWICRDCDYRRQVGCTYSRCIKLKRLPKEIRTIVIEYFQTKAKGNGCFHKKGEKERILDALCETCIKHDFGVEIVPGFIQIYNKENCFAIHQSSYPDGLNLKENGEWKYTIDEALDYKPLVNAPQVVREWKGKLET